MGLVVRPQRFVPRSAPARGPLDDFWYTPIAGYLGHSGMPVTADAALTISAIWRGLTFLSSNLASLPCNVIQRLERGRQVAETHRLFPVLRWRPNSWQSPLEYLEMMMGHTILRGNAYAEIAEGRRGFVDQLIPRNPDRMKVEMLSNGALKYTYRLPDGSERVYGQERMHHWRGFGSDGIRGLSLIEYGAQAFGTHLSAESYAARFFNQGATAQISVTHPGVLGPEGRQNLTDSIRSYLTGLKNAGGVLILEEGLQPHLIGLDPEKAQLILTRRFTVEDVARWLGLPLHVFMSTETSAQAYASLEVKSLELIVYAFRTWAIRLEQAMMRDLLLERELGEFRIEFNLDALARGDFKSRGEFYGKLFNVGAFSPNDILELENRNPVDGGDQRFVPAAMVPLDQAAELATGRQPGAVDAGDRGDRADKEVEARAMLYAQDIAGRLVRREVAAVTAGAKRFSSNAEGWRTWLREFYDEHAAHVARDLRISMPAAREYAGRQGLRLEREGIGAAADWEWTVVPELTTLALGRGRCEAA